jgi:16S rRNA G527 N7-methylase RsmG
VTRTLTLTDVNIQNVRAETLPPSTFDVVTLRAVEHFSDTLSQAATLLAPGGRLALLIGASQLDTARSTLPHLAWEPPLPVPESESRLLVVATLA